VPRRLTSIGRPATSSCAGFPGKPKVELGVDVGQERMSSTYVTRA
jgi:hypothetical protein